jgi:hypothetical protein
MIEATIVHIVENLKVPHNFLGWQHQVPALQKPVLRPFGFVLEKLKIKAFDEISLGKAG